MAFSPAIADCRKRAPLAPHLSQQSYFSIKQKKYQQFMRNKNIEKCGNIKILETNEKLFIKNTNRKYIY